LVLTFVVGGLTSKMLFASNYLKKMNLKCLFTVIISARPFKKIGGITCFVVVSTTLNEH
jgi:hypothetical protein